MQCISIRHIFCFTVDIQSKQTCRIIIKHVTLLFFFVERGIKRLPKAGEGKNSNGDDTKQFQLHNRLGEEECAPPKVASIVSADDFSISSSESFASKRRLRLHFKRNSRFLLEHFRQDLQAGV
ncbi:hypothetical protein CDAR_524941 [Caerostris darwini]|uniref:Uncharacterized protein n=1 Tax=Caerostris darwini TaxID=1538125 RepID=A0AAV4R1F5_9ARAC|nr:hypothetical protein CDAR_524941 [Caerostris darwini]